MIISFLYTGRRIFVEESLYGLWQVSELHKYHRIMFTIDVWVFGQVIVGGLSLYFYCLLRVDKWTVGVQLHLYYRYSGSVHDICLRAIPLYCIRNLLLVSGHRSFSTTKHWAATTHSDSM